MDELVLPSEREARFGMGRTKTDASSKAKKNKSASQRSYVDVCFPVFVFLDHSPFVTHSLFW